MCVGVCVCVCVCFWKPCTVGTYGCLHTNVVRTWRTVRTSFEVLTVHFVQFLSKCLLHALASPLARFCKSPQSAGFSWNYTLALHTLAGIPSVFVFGAYTRGVMRMRVLSTHAPNAVRAPFCWTETGWRIPTGKYVCGKKTPFSTYFSKPIATRQRRAETSEVTNLTKSERGCREGISAPTNINDRRCQLSQAVTQSQWSRPDEWR